MAEKKRKMSPERWVVLGLLVVLVSVLAGFAVASAVVTNSDGTVNACYGTKNGKLRVATSACKAGKETGVTLGSPPFQPIWANVGSSGNLLEHSPQVTSVTKQGTGGYGINVTGTPNLLNCSAQVTPLTIDPVAVFSESNTPTQWSVSLSEVSNNNSFNIDKFFSIHIDC